MSDPEGNPPASSDSRRGLTPRRKLILAAALVCAVLLAFLVFVWPTAHRSTGEGRRVNRLTGHAEKYDPGKRSWRSAGRGQGNTSATYSGSESPIGGGPPGSASAGHASESRPAARGETWWYQDSRQAPRKEARGGAQGGQWWYQDKEEKRAEKAPPEEEADSTKEAPADNWWHD